MTHGSNIGGHMADLMKDVREIGRDLAAGQDALPKLALRVLKAADMGIISLDKDPTDGRDDAARVYEEVISAHSKKAVHEHTDAGKKANISKLRAVVKLAVEAASKYDPVQTITEALDIRKELIAADPKSVKPAYAAIVDIARLQVAMDRQMTKDELTEAVRKAAPADPDLEKKLSTIMKSLEKIITGEAGVKDDDPRTVEAFNQVKERVGALMQFREDQALNEALAARGLKAVGADEQLVSEIEGEQPTEAQMSAETIGDALEAAEETTELEAA